MNHEVQHDSIFTDPRHMPGYKFPKASLGNRFVASFLDGLLTMLLCAPAIAAFAFASSDEDSYGEETNTTLIFVGVFLLVIPIAYNLLKDGFGQGQSIGKKAMGLVVVNLEDNSPCTKTKSFVRNMVSFLCQFIPLIGGLLEPIMVLATPDGRKIGDKAANTQVVNSADYEAPYA